LGIFGRIKKTSIFASHLKSRKNADFSVMTTSLALTKTGKKTVNDHRILTGEMAEWSSSIAIGSGGLENLFF